MSEEEVLEIRPSLLHGRGLMLVGLCLVASIAVGVAAFVLELATIQRAVMLCGIFFTGLFLFDALTERLSFVHGQFEFRSLFRRPQQISLVIVDQLAINPRGWAGYFGFVSMHFVKRNKVLQRFDLGPFWPPIVLDRFIETVVARRSS